MSRIKLTPSSTMSTDSAAMGGDAKSGGAGSRLVAALKDHFKGIKGGTLYDATVRFSDDGETVSHTRNTGQQGRVSRFRKALSTDITPRDTPIPMIPICNVHDHHHNPNQNQNQNHGHRRGVSQSQSESRSQQQKGIISRSASQGQALSSIGEHPNHGHGHNDGGNGNGNGSLCSPWQCAHSHELYPPPPPGLRIQTGGVSFGPSPPAVHDVPPVLPPKPASILGAGSRSASASAIPALSRGSGATPTATPFFTPVSSPAPGGFLNRSNTIARAEMRFPPIKHLDHTIVNDHHYGSSNAFAFGLSSPSHPGAGGGGGIGGGGGAQGISTNSSSADMSLASAPGEGDNTESDAVLAALTTLLMDEYRKRVSGIRTPVQNALLERVVEYTMHHPTAFAAWNLLSAASELQDILLARQAILMFDKWLASDMWASIKYIDLEMLEEEEWNGVQVGWLKEIKKLRCRSMGPESGVIVGGGGGSPEGWVEERSWVEVSGMFFEEVFW